MDIHKKLSRLLVIDGQAVGWVGVDVGAQFVGGDLPACEVANPQHFIDGNLVPLRHGTPAEAERGR